MNVSRGALTVARVGSDQPRVPGIVAFHIADWSAFEGAQTWHHVLAGLAKEFPVLYVERPLDRHEAGLEFRGRSSRDHGVRRVAENLHVYTPPAFLPRLYRPERVAALLRRLRHAALAKLTKRLGIGRVVRYLFHPGCLDEASGLPAAVRCFHVYDNYRAFDRALASQFVAAERELVRSSNLVFAASPLLYEQCLADNSDTYLIHNGVDMSVFDDHERQQSPEPSELVAIPHPRAAYTGTLNEHVDLVLLRHIAQVLAGWSLVLMGKLALTSPESQRLFEDLCHLPNVFFLGFRPPWELPAYLDGFDVCLIPYRMNEVVRLGYPGKLNVYLAAGKPVIAAPMPCMSEAEGLVVTADSPEDWVKAVLRSVRDDRPELARARQAFARRHDWSCQVGRISQLIRSRLEQAAAAPGRGVRA